MAPTILKLTRLTFADVIIGTSSTKRVSRTRSFVTTRPSHLIQTTHSHMQGWRHITIGYAHSRFCHQPSVRRLPTKPHRLPWRLIPRYRRAMPHLDRQYFVEILAGV